MKAILPCGGFAKRLWPLTLDRPKALLDVGGRAILDHIVDKIEYLPDVDEIILTTNAAFEPIFRNWLSSRRFSKPVNLLVEPHRSETEKFGVIRGMNWLLGQHKIDADCMIIAGDNLFDFDLADLVRFYKKVGSPVVALYDVGVFEKAKLYGIAKLDGTRIIDFQEKPQAPPSTLAATCCYIFPKDVLSEFDKYLAGGLNPDAPGHFVSWLSKQRAVHGWTWSGVWFDIGDFVSLEKARQWALMQK